MRTTWALERYWGETIFFAFYTRGSGFKPEKSLGHVVFDSSVSRFVCLSVHNFFLLTYKVEYLKFSWWHSNQILTVDSSKSTHISLTSHTLEVGHGQNVGYKIFALYELQIHWIPPNKSWLCFYYTPVFRRDVLWYGDVRPSVRPGLRPSVRPSQFSALFSYMLWHNDLKFCVSLYFYARKIKFECHQFPSLFAGVMLLFNFKLLQICSFPQFSPTCFDILSSNFVYDFVLMYHRASLSVVILLQFLLELCLFVNLEYSKYTVFRTFLLHALTYWAEILHMTLFYCTTDQVRVSSICVNFCGSYAPFGT